MVIFLELTSLTYNNFPQLIWNYAAPLDLCMPCIDWLPKTRNFHLWRERERERERMWNRRAKGNEEKLVKVAIDKDKRSQWALKWALDRLLSRLQTVRLIHHVHQPQILSLPTTQSQCNSLSLSQCICFWLVYGNFEFAQRACDDDSNWNCRMLMHCEIYIQVYIFCNLGLPNCFWNSPCLISFCFLFSPIFPKNTETWLVDT